MKFKQFREAPPDYFKPGLNINEATLKGLRESYQCRNDDYSNKILNFLNAVDIFISFSDPLFAETGQSTMTDVELLAKIKLLSNDFKSFIEIKNRLNANSIEYQVMDKALDFSLQFVGQRIEQLKGITNDRIYNLYESNESYLKSILDVGIGPKI